MTQQDAHQVRGTRSTSRTGRLLRRGFTDPDAALRQLATAALAPLRDDSVLLDALGQTADPDLALLGLARLAEALAARDAADHDALLQTLTASKPLRDRLLGVLGASAALADHLARHPGDWHILDTYEVVDVDPHPEDFRTALAAAVRADGPTDPHGSPVPATAADRLRVAYRRCLLGIAARDVCGTVDVARTAADLADLAAATLQTALEIASAEFPEDAAACRLAVIGMGKCGGRELNYVSDVDVIFVAEPAETPDGAESPAGREQAALRSATKLAARLMRLCSDTTVEGTIWPVDANLRPEGKNGPLVRTLASHLAYYRRWARTWEYQALLKARPVAGDARLGAAYCEAVAPLVWQSAERAPGSAGESWVAEVQAMRRRVVESIPAGQAERELKLGPGGLRDVEFAVQLLQLVHGRSDATLRSGTTLVALRALAEGGYVGRADAAAMEDAYRFLRTVEHRIQLVRLRRTHLMPDAEPDLRRLGRSLGLRADPVAELHRAWKRHSLEVRRLHEKLFYRPLLDAVARLAPGEVGLSPEAARTRLTALGFADPAAALRHLSALTAGLTRKAAIQRTLLPVLLAWFAESADPDAGLLAFRRVSDALGDTPWYLRQLRDEGAAAEYMARILASGRLAPDLLMRAPEAVAMLGDPDELRPRGRAALEAEIRASVGRATGPEQAVTAARGVRRRELFRTAAADILTGLGATDFPAPAEHVGDVVDAIGAALTDVNAATVAGALQAAIDAEERSSGAPLPTRLAVIAMGRFGGRELGYGSDADVLFVHDPLDGVAEEDAYRAALRVTNELRRLLQLPATDPPLEVDADLRPEGRQGPLVRTLAAYRAYYERWAQVWESQALLRAEPAAGDAELGRRFMEVVDPVRYPDGGLRSADVREIRRIKARVENERMPRGTNPATHTKLGPGGLADVEWTVQLLQLCHAREVPELRTTRTRRALAAAVDAGLLTPEDGRVLDEAWVLATRVRNAVMLVRGRPGDTFPSDTRELTGVAHLLGYPAGHVGDAIEEYRRVSRRARAVVERVFYGDGGD
ncbi:bifunctional [glutamine synthetase] adenylyltransferase/[glutamine synthetase]-adenylyl-L-tyrosine phosphorylase [Allostreptomyces psammosilenae]|uniref:Bifunctional glutamine synthetase adenylyltransferase/adenylyl-removing enzyme n=1 Tax=Allostreptomyces psammosilenae TaxID=1892865 RepID=A0A852ZX68_9ACTN|nr:bifunctional [glutamine synthetase] adenylyltransferase/[glutamine synthetase]-adenylyl-L-tyrosine phosphorylase [Allostreptomyces psammosilenae]NYI06956.1 glutamate-ammonia-ligase adenylyltransferase [Allostreptomyces psammosilenae]